MANLSTCAHLLDDNPGALYQVLYDHFGILTVIASGLQDITGTGVRVAFYVQAYLTSR